MMAAGSGKTDVVQLLLQHGANPNLKTTFGSSALKMAEENGRADTSAILRSAGAIE